VVIPIFGGEAIPVLPISSEVTANILQKSSIAGRAKPFSSLEHILVMA
jgi:hypothetical protein